MWSPCRRGGKAPRVRTFLLVVGLALLVPSAARAGEPIVLPDFTPASTSDFSLASLLHQATASMLSRSGHIVLSAEVVEPVVGGMVACADDPGCPQTQLGQLPARFAVVVGVRRTDDKIFADIQLFERTSSAAIERRTVRVVDGNEDQLGRDIADMVQELAQVMGPADGSQLIAAARLIAQAEAADAEPSEPERPARDRPAKPEPLSAEARIEQALQDSDLTERHLVGVRDHFVDSGLDIRDWVYEYTPHAGRTIIEVRAGYGIGDTDRIAYVRTTVPAGGGEQARWFREGPTSGERVRGELFIGYAPSAWVDIGALLGLQYGERVLDSAWSTPGEGGGQGLDQVQAVQFHLQPRVRLYPVRTGPFKPYVFGGVDLRFFDQWRIRPVDNIEYSQPPGGFAAGPAGGLGFLVDPSPLVGLFIEGCALTHTTQRGGHVEFPSGNRPDGFTAPLGAGYLVVISGGVQFRL